MKPRGLDGVGDGLNIAMSPFCSGVKKVSRGRRAGKEASLTGFLCVVAFI